jgi:hypothetical protein
VLGECLREQHRRAPNGDLTGLAKRFQKKLARVNKVPWMLATSVDFQYPATEGGKPARLNRLTSGYMANLARLSMEDPFVHLIFIHVLHLLKPPSVLFHPRIAFAVLRYSIKQHPLVEAAHKTESNNLNRMTEGYR